MELRSIAKLLNTGVLAVVSFLASTATATTVVANFDNLIVNKAPPSGYPIAGFSWSGFWVTPVGDAPGFNTQSISTTTSTAKIGTVTPASGYTLTSFGASNAGNSSATVSASCSGNTTVSVSLAASQTATINTNWSTPCLGAITLTTSNAWSTDLDNLTFNSSTTSSLPTITFSANPTSITSGQSSTLSYSSTNATSCTGSGFTASGTSGTTSVSPTATTTYSISCTGSGGSTSASTTVTVSPASSGQSLFNLQVPAGLNESDGPGVNYELGTEFYSDVAGMITAIRFYKSPNESGTHIGRIFSASGQQLAQATFAAETASGWQIQTLAVPIVILANTNYVVTVNTGNTYYVDTVNGLASQIVNGDLRSVIGNNGLYGAPGTFPTNSWYASNYFRDVVFQAGPAVPTYTISGNLSPATLTAGAKLTLSGPTSQTITADASGNYSFSVTTNGTYTVTPSGSGLSFTPANQSVIMNGANISSINFTATSSSNVVFYDDFTGTALSPAWTVIQRRGPASQDEIECNTAGAVSVANGLLNINTSATPATCGDAVTAPTQLPYTSGDVQWTSLNFTYGTVEVRAKFPSQQTGTWPAIWLLGSNCQAANLINGSESVAFDGCPAQGNAAYQEIDMIECDQRSWCHLTMAQGSYGWTSLCGFQVDSNWHVFTLTWNSSLVSMAVDGKPTGCSYPNTSLHGPMFLIMQTQVTSANGVAGAPNNSLLPTNFQIDYVKVTQP